MNIFFSEHLLIIKQLQTYQVRFLLIGGYAVIFHGYNRTTGDMDIWIDPDEENKSKFIACLFELEYRQEDIDYLRSLDFTKAQVFSIGEEPQRVDFLTQVNLLNFKEAYENKMIAPLDGLEIPYIHFNDLVLMKMNTGRLKDKSDVEELQKIRNLGKHLK